MPKKKTKQKKKATKAPKKGSAKKIVRTQKNKPAKKVKSVESKKVEQKRAPAAPAKAISGSPDAKDAPSIVLSERKIKLEAGGNNYSNAIRSKYGTRTAKVAKPVFVFLKVMLSIAMFMAMSLAALFVVFGRDLPDVSELKSMNFSETTVIYDREGNILYRIFSEENRKYVSLSDIAPVAITATLSIEDKNFFVHPGFDALGMVRAQLKNLEEDDIKQGASTITQQLAKNIFLSRERTYERKIKEFLIALQIESMFSKEDILEMYLNKIAYGSNAYGIEAASKTFFGKSASELTLSESAILASLPKAPSYFSPYGQNKRELMGYCETRREDSMPTELPVQPATEENGQGEAPSEILTVEKEGPEAPDFLVCASPEDPNYVIGRKDLVLQRMIEDGHITRAQMMEAWKDAFDIEFKNPAHRIESPHFVFYVKEYLEQKYGKELVESGGLEVVTTLDPKMQSLAEEIIASNAENNKRRFLADNAAMTALDVRTGQVLAMVGSVNYWNSENDGQVNVTTRPRQPGSAFKPLVYAAAIQNGGIGSGTILSDTKTTFERNYVPKNSDNTYKGRMSVRTALAQSRNIPAIKASYIAGEEEKLLDFMDKIGIKTLRRFKESFNLLAEERGWTFHYGPALAIGSGEITLLELVSGFATLGNGGQYMVVNPILEIRDRDGNLIESFRPEGEQAMDPQSAYIVNNILSDVFARPGGTWRYTLTIPGHTVAAKTGTSNKKIGRTNYPNNLLTVGYTPSIAAGFWTGNTNGDRLAYNAWGLTASAPMWKSFMTAVLADKPDEPFDVPEGIIWRGKEAFPSFQDNTNYDKMFKSEEKEEEEEEVVDYVERDAAGVPVDTFVGEKTLIDLEEESGAGEDAYVPVDVPESDFTGEGSVTSGEDELPPPVEAATPPPVADPVYGF